MRRGPSASAGALATLAIGFAASALLRAGEVVAALPGDGFGNAIPHERAGAAAPAGEPGALTLIADLRQRQGALAAREAALEDRRQALEAAESRIEERLRQLEEAQRRLEQTAVLVDDAAGRDVRHLADMYLQMKPKQAAQIFDQMPPSLAAGFLGEMAPEAAALILANMVAERAYAASLLLAGRNVNRDGAGGGPAAGATAAPPPFSIP